MVLPRLFPLSSALLCATAVLAAQRGDHPGEEQPPLPADLVVPPAPVLGPADALAAMRVQPGYRVELCAAEPLVEDPVAIAWDGAGRLWVVEMRGYMPDVDATNELAPNGVIAVLTDTDGDGAMDQRTVFLDGLVLPRGVLPVPGGCLVIEPPHLWYCRDTDSDLRCDERTGIGDGFDAGHTNPEHAGNGLTWGLDNWIHLANHPYRYRWSPAGFTRASTFGGGQWGLGMDDRGRLWFDYNSDWLRMNRFPGHYGVRHPHLGLAGGLNQQVVRDQSVHPIRVTPGINRGYQKGMLVEGRLARTTACCGPVIYRGGLMPELRGDVFVCEPAGNLVRRFVITEPAGTAPTGRNPYPGGEFLASTDERFRPVNLANGPDGALYVVDMYRGVLQHRNFVTTWLRKQIEERGLQKPLGLGRIWRVVADGAARQPFAGLAFADGATLVAHLEHAHGTVRDLAQQALVAQRDRGVVPALRALARTPGPAVPRLHAMFTLEGLGALDRTDLFAALHDDDPALRSAGVRLAEPFLLAGRDAMLRALVEHLAATDQDAAVMLQTALSLGEVQAEWATRALAVLAVRNLGDGLLRSAVASGLHRREVAFLRQLVAEPGFAESSAGGQAWLRLVSRACAGEDDEAGRTTLLDFIGARMATWQQEALLDGILEALPKGDARRGWLRFSATPTALLAMQRTGDPGVVPKVQEVLQATAIALPPGAGESEPGLDAGQKALFAAGARLYGATCAACHQPDGRGLAGLAPPLRDSEWLTGPADRVVRIVLNGLTGPLEVAGERWDMDMPPQVGLQDQDIAAVVTYVRRAFGHRAGAVGKEEVAAIRAVDKGRKGQWSAEELRAR